MVAVEEKKVLFVHIPHCAGTSISTLFERNFPSSQAVFSTWDNLDVLDGTKYEDYYKFCVVRNHWEWIFSKWSYISKIGSGRALGTSYSNLSGPDKKLYDYIIKQKNSFNDYVAWFLSENSSSPDMPQKRGFFYWGGENMNKIDKVIKLNSGKFEGFEEVQKKLGIKNNKMPPHLNINKKIGKEAIYNRSSIELVRRQFKEELEFFEYSFN